MRNLRPLVAAILGIAVASCAEPPRSVERCIPGLKLDRPLLVLESDLSAASALARIDTNGCVTERPSLALGGDPSLVISRNRVFVVIRDRSRIAEIDPAGPLLIEGGQFDIPPADIMTNPHDVVVASDGTLWVPRYNMSSLGVFRDDGALIAEIDLSAYADDDGIPEMESAIAVGDKVYVALERLLWTGARYVTTESSLVVALDVVNRSVAEVIPLQGRAPFGRLVPSPEDETVFFAAVPGHFDAIDERDGIERIDTKTGTSRLVARETELGGSVSEIALASETQAYAIVARPEASNDTSLVEWNPTTGARVRTLATTPSEYRLWGLTIAGNEVIVGDRERTAPRLRVFSRDTGNEKGSIPLEVLPPVSIISL